LQGDHEHYDSFKEKLLTSSPESERESLGFPESVSLQTGVGEDCPDPVRPGEEATPREGDMVPLSET
jgi:hypothetical protein